MTYRLFAALAGAACLAAVGAAASDKPVYLNMGATPSSSGHFAYWVSVGQSIEKAEGRKFVVNVMETNSSVDNLRRLRRGEIEFGLGAAEATAQAYHGMGAFEGQPPFKDVRMLWVYIGAPNIYVAREDSGVSKLAELTGKPYNAGIPGSSSESMTLATFKALGIEPKLHKGSTADAVNATRDGQIVGFGKSAASATVPDSSFIELNTTTKVRVIGVTQAEMDKVLKDYPYLGAITVPAGVYPGQSEPYITTVVAPGGAATVTSLSEEDAYHLTKAVFEHKAVQEAAFPAVKKSDYLKATLEYVSSPLHAGAIRYLREKGVEIPAKLIPPEAK